MLIVAVLNWSLSSWKSFVNHLSFGAAPPDAGVTTQRAVEVWIYGLTWRRNNLGNNSLGGTPGVLLGIIGINFMKQPWKQFTQRGILYTWDPERTGVQSGKKHDFFHLRSILFSGRIWKKQTWLSIVHFPPFSGCRNTWLADSWIKFQFKAQAWCNFSWRSELNLSLRNHSSFASLATKSLGGATYDGKQHQYWNKRFSWFS